MTDIPSSALPVQFARRAPRRLQEREILRVCAGLFGEDQTLSATKAREEILRWAQGKVIGGLPQQAWEHQSFEHLSSGRSCTAVRLKDPDQDIWCLRIEDPDKNVAGRTWTTEITTTLSNRTQTSGFTLRLLVGTQEESLVIEPHVPGVIRQLIGHPGLVAGTYRLVNYPIVVRSKHAAEVLANALVDPARKLPIIAMSVPSGADNPFQPLLDAKTLAEACAGLAITVVIPAEFTWELTERFGKQLSVYEGAARVYLPGFTEDANPFGGHELVLPPPGLTAVIANKLLTKLRWIAANGSVRRLTLGKDIMAFALIKAKEIQQRQQNLEESGATEREQLDAAREHIALLESELEEAAKFQKEFSDLHAAAEDRAESAETQLRASNFRIQQLLEQIKGAGNTPDAKIALPEDWVSFVTWCDVNLAGRLLLAPQARKALKGSVFEDVSLAAKCLMWLANDYRNEKIGDSSGSLRDRTVAPGVTNAHCGADSFRITWQGEDHDVEWHIKNGGNTRDPARCLRIYYFWDDASQQVVIASMPAHIRTDAT